MNAERQKSRRSTLLELFQQAAEAEKGGGAEPSRLQRLIGLLRQNWTKAFGNLIAPAGDKQSARRCEAQGPIKQRIVEFFHRLGIEISAESLFSVRLKGGDQITIVITPTHGEISERYRRSGVSVNASSPKLSLTEEQITILRQNGFSVTGGSCVTGPAVMFMKVLGEKS